MNGKPLPKTVLLGRLRKHQCCALLRHLSLDNVVFTIVFLYQPMEHILMNLKVALTVSILCSGCVAGSDSGSTQSSQSRGWVVPTIQSPFSFNAYARADKICDADQNEDLINRTPHFVSCMASTLGVSTQLFSQVDQQLSSASSNQTGYCKSSVGIVRSESNKVLTLMPIEQWVPQNLLSAYKGCLARSQINYTQFVSVQRPPLASQPVAVPDNRMSDPFAISREINALQNSAPRVIGDVNLLDRPRRPAPTNTNCTSTVHGQNIQTNCTTQ